MWCATHCCFRTRCSLAQEAVQCEDACIHCNVMAETHTHIFFVFHKALNCWALVHLDNSVPELVLMANNFTTLLVEFLAKLNPQQKSIACMILWSLWKNRN